jgi:hypothetical protein
VRAVTLVSKLAALAGSEPEELETVVEELSTVNKRTKFLVETLSKPPVPEVFTMAAQLGTYIWSGFGTGVNMDTLASVLTKSGGKKLPTKAHKKMFLLLELG